MKEIKFRAYAQNTEVMVYQKDFNKWIDGFIMHVDFKPWDDCETELMAEYIWIENEGETHNPDNPPVHTSDNMVKLMQYTGLTDKNGTEIYEGDVLHLEGYAVMYVEFVDGEFVAKSTNSIQRVNWQPLRLIALVNKGYKVIGNLYEHPDLLGDNNAR